MSAIIQTLWVGNPLTVIEQLSLTSFVAHGHEVHLYTYGDVGNIPKGVIKRNAAEVLPESSVFTKYGGSYAQFSDWFRWKLLNERGGYWVDTDVICLKPFDFNETLVFGRESDQQINGAVIAIPPGHKLAELMLSTAIAPLNAQEYDDAKARKRKFRARLLRRGDKAVKWGYAGGPASFTKALQYLDLVTHAKSHLAFYPINPTNWDAIFDSTYASGMGAFQDSYAIHLWNEMMRRKPGFDKNGRFPADSLIERLKATYLK